MNDGTIFCPACESEYLETQPCEHYRNLGYKPGENEGFFQRRIREGYEPGSWTNRNKFKKHIGTSVGNTRTKDTTCKACGKNLNHFSQDKIAAHIAKHAEEEEKTKAQTRLF